MFYGKSAFLLRKQLFLSKGVVGCRILRVGDFNTAGIQPRVLAGLTPGIATSPMKEESKEVMSHFLAVPLKVKTFPLSKEIVFNNCKK